MIASNVFKFISAVASKIWEGKTVGMIVAENTPWIVGGVVIITLAGVFAYVSCKAKAEPKKHDDLYMG